MIPETLTDNGPIDRNFRAVDDTGRALGYRLDTAEATLAYVRTGTGDPETVVTAPVGTIFLRTDGGAASTLYIKESGAGNTGWVSV